MSDQPPPAKTFDPSPPSLETSEYLAFHGKDSMVVLSAQDQGLSLDSSFNTKARDIYIYSETIYLLSDTIKLPGLHLNLFCRRFKLLKDKVSIDVSGIKGAGGNDKTVKGSEGGKGGSICLCVEDPDPDLLSKLTLKSSGGDGGRGFNQTNGTDEGGDGGNGGSCGSIRCFVNFPLIEYAKLIYRTTSNEKLKWPDWSKQFAETIESDCTTLKAWGFYDKVADDWKTFVVQHIGLAQRAKSLSTALRNLTEGDLGDPGHVLPTEATRNLAKLLISSLKAVLEEIPAPVMQNDFKSESFDALISRCEDFTGGAASEKHLRNAMQEVLATVNSLVPHNEPAILCPMLSISTQIMGWVRAEAEKFTTKFITDVCKVNGGRGGSGGSGATLEIKPGKRGSDQPDGQTVVQLLSLDDPDVVQEIDRPIAFPEHCQMLLDNADALYFTNDVVNFPKALRIYNQLTRRLIFLDALRTANGQWINDHPMVKSFNNLVYLQLTAEPLQLLFTIYNTAQKRQNKLMLRKDLFCHSPDWVPRLSMTFYEDRITKLIRDFGLIETLFEKYAKAEQKEQVLSQYVKEVQRVNDGNAQATRNQIERISKAGGELETAGIVIAQYTPQLRAGREKMIATLKDLTQYIENSFHVSPEKVVEAMSSWAMAPHAFFGVMTGLEVAYKSWTSLENLQGVEVRKEFVVDQLETCQGTVESLTETFKHLRGELTVDSPGYGKILATLETVQKVLEDFKKVIPADKRASVQQELDNFVALILKRNNAVVSYNAQLQWLLHLSTLAESYERESKTLGDHALSLNPQLPTIYFWLKRMKATMQLDILQRLNYEGRALAFWGPIDIKTVTFDPPGPLDGAVQLRKHQKRLDDLFESCCDAFSSGTWTHWPASRDLLHTGHIIDISSIIPFLKKQTTDPDGRPVHEASFSISPNSIKAFRTMSNVRIKQVRVWCFGATVAPNEQGESRLIIDIHHLGFEKIWDLQGQPYNFDHSPVVLQFLYETSIFNKNMKCSGDPALVFSRQDIENDYSGTSGDKPKSGDRPPMGPFADWKISIYPEAHESLNLADVNKVWVEFCGRNQPALRPLKGVV